MVSYHRTSSRLIPILAPALSMGLAACGSGGGGGSSFFVETCSLGCSSGASGSQVSCGIQSTFVNQEIALLFNQDVKASSLDKLTFQIFDVQTTQVPPGSYFVDPTNPRRAIFRPKLSFDGNGNPVFGFQKGQSYQIRVPGTAQGDAGPYIESDGGAENVARVLCTVTTDQDPVDPLPGPPSVSVFVDTVDPNTGQITVGVPADGAINVSKSSKITMVFGDIMLLGTIVLPTSGTIPFIKFKIDPDGNLATTGDQVEIGGSMAFSIDQSALQTTAVFTPASPFPSAGPNPASPRRIVVELPATVTDLVGNGLANAGIISFVPEGGTFTTVTIPTGGEQFTDQTRMDANRTGADWGETTSGRLTAGRGGGSGRLGDLTVNTNETLVLYTSPWPAEGTITFSANPSAGQFIILGQTGTPPQTINITFNTSGGTATTSKIQPFLSYTLATLLTTLQNSASPLITAADYAIVNGNTLRIRHKTPGAVGQTFTLGTSVNFPATISGPTLTGGVDAVSFSGSGLVTNFDFQSNPGGSPGPIAVADGIFEFARIDLKPSSTLRFVGTNPARLFARGRVVLGDLARIDIAGASLGSHNSRGPSGQYGARGGPSGGTGGDGADRRDYTGSNPPGGLLSQGAVEFPYSFILGRPGWGVGGQTIGNGSGLGGTFWPDFLPVSQTNPGGMETAAAVGSLCTSQQVGAPGSGGAYATDGTPGVPVAVTANSSQGGSNTPATTPGGSSASVGIEPPEAPPVVRKLTPKFGYLRGGAGGGGGGMHIESSEWTQQVAPCITGTGFISKYSDHSAAAGGGAGGAIQLVGGRQIQLNGRIDAAGGTGGSNFGTGSSDERRATAGGGGSGGAALFQATTFTMAPGAGRVVVQGGVGGTGANASAGGSGGAGLVRIEGLNSLSQTTLALGVLPTDVTDPTSKKWLSVGSWDLENVVPDSFSGAQSCWMKASGNVFALTFEEDDPLAPSVGWDMDVILNLGGPPTTASYRTSTVFGGNSPQAFWGELLNRELQFGQVAAPLVVRFQGAKSSGTIADLCNVDPTAPGSGILPDSVTPWVRHPSELNDFDPKPDLVRFLIVFDASNSEFSKIVGVTNLRIKALPE
jgi:hypothetical protein